MSKIAGVLKDFYAAHQQKVFQATAPGRLDVMGGFADFSGSLLLQKPLLQETNLYLAFREDPQFTIRFFCRGEEKTFSASYEELIGNFKSINYEYSRQQILAKEGGDWAIFIAGTLLVFFQERKLKPEGVNIIVSTDVPSRKGVAASASVNVALLQALKNGLSLNMGEYEIPKLAQKAENWVVGFPSGMMDTLAVHTGKQNKLMPMICQPSEVFHPIDVPDSIKFIGIHSGISPEQHEAFLDARTAAYMGYSIIALAAGASLRDLEVAKETNQTASLPYRGYLANITPSEFEDKFLPLLPESISGEAFLVKYRTIIDPLSFINRDKEYRILNCTRHPVYENFRVMLFSQILKNYTTEFQNYSNRLSLLGELMYQSHQSYTDCGLGHQRTDEIVKMVKDAGHKKGLYGARVTSRGQGGTVCILSTGLNGPEAARALHQTYMQRHSLQTEFFE